MGCLLGGRAGRYVRSAGTCYEQLTTVYPDLEDVDLQQPTPPLDPINGTVVNGYFRKGTDSRDKRTSVPNGRECSPRCLKADRRLRICYKR